MKTGRYSLAQLIGSDNIDQVVIPEMQRDYVWKAENVSALLRSIEAKWQSKKTLSLGITAEGHPIEDVLQDYLTKEYERLRFSTRIGFIYAYYDSSDSRRLYLIDGQQRITTLYLLLLALYSRAGKAKDFLDRYMPQPDHPKLDYRVRESAHRFLVDFIGHILDNPAADFRSESKKYYSIYDHDPTVKSILANFKVIRQWADQLVDLSRLPDLIDYIENFIEFNYFDTGLSRQGERLYLYMNSRGEQLSQQEQIRPTIIARAAGQKLAVGRDWERWQNFFWQHRYKENQKANADMGFKGFLKVAVILHQARFPETKMKDREVRNGRLQGLREVREDYIREQREWWITNYIIDNPSTFKYEWLSKVFAAYKRLSDIYDRIKSKNGDFIGKFPFIRDWRWRSAESIQAINYIPLCGTLLLEILYREQGIPVSDENLYRMAMYLLCRSDNENNYKNPDMATIQAMEMAIAMHEAGVQDVRDLSPRVEIKVQHMRDYESLMWKRIHDADWERLYWEIVHTPTLNRFFNGTHDVLFRLADEDVDNVTYEEFESFYSKFAERFFKVKDAANLRKTLLAYGDISMDAGNLTDKLGNGKWMEQWKFPANDFEWHEVFKKKDYRAIVRDYVNGLTPAYHDSNVTVIAKGIDIMSPSYYKYLWDNPDGALYPDIVILTRCNPKKKLAQSLPSYLLQKRLMKKGHKAWHWNEDFRICVVDFKIVDGEYPLRFTDGEKGNFAIDFVYKWDAHKPSWDISIVGRPIEVGDYSTPLREIADYFNMEELTEWEAIADNPHRIRLKREFVDTKPYDHEGNLQSITDILAWYDAMWQGLVAAYKKNK